MAMQTMDEVRANLERLCEEQAAVVAREQDKLAKLDAALRALSAETSVTAAPRQDFAGMAITLATMRLLEEAGPGAAFTTRGIADAIRARGVVSNSKNFIPTVYATLANSDAFARDKGEGKWALKTNAREKK